MKVEVYWNLHKDCFSVRKSGGKVLFHAHQVELSGVKFVVQAAGRKRVLREKRKNVHAFVRGYITTQYTETDKVASYNPYKADYFYNKETDQKIAEAPFVRLTAGEGKPTIHYTEEV